MPKFNLYRPSDLPAGFVYPPAFVALSGEVDPAPSYPPWWFIDADSRAGELMKALIKEQGCVPFAKTDRDDDIACFDGADCSGNPRVVMVCSTPERSYGFADFTAWLKQANLDASQHRIT